jgi:hypothetical protein
VIYLQRQAQLTLNNCHFTTQDDTGRWICSKCGRSSGRPRNTPPVRMCLMAIHHQSACSMHEIVAVLTPYGVDRLQKCREADCGLMHDVNGTIRCVGMGGGKCTWIGKWAKCLNGETPFPNGENECPHWEQNG